MKSKNEIPKLKSIWKNKRTIELRRLIAYYVKTNFKGLEVVNQDLKITVKISVTSGRKTARGGAMYHKKAESIRVLPKIIEIAKYNNFGNRKSTDSKEIIGYFNFKSKFSILEPDEGFYRAITMDEFKQKVLVMVDKLDKKYGRK